MDVDEVWEWPVEKLFGWLAYFEVKGAQEKKATDKARADAAKGSKRKKR